MRLADVTHRLSDVSQRYHVPERLSAASEKVREGVGAAYQMAREHPRTSIGAAIAAAAIIGGVLWYLFGGNESRPVQRRRSHARVRTGGERRKKHRTARAAAT